MSIAVQDVPGNLINSIRMQECLLVLRGTQFFLILFAFYSLELWTDIVVVHLELEYLLVTDRIRDDI